MSWTAVGVADEALLKRCIEIVAEANPEAPPLDLATMRAGIAHEQMHWFYYEGDAFELSLEFLFHRRRNQYVVCANFIGGVDPAKIVDLVVAQGQTFVAARGRSSLYAVRPNGMRPSPLTEFYDLLWQTPALRLSIVASLSDAEIWQIDSLALTGV